MVMLMSPDCMHWHGNNFIITMISYDDQGHRHHHIVNGKSSTPKTTSSIFRRDSLSLAQLADVASAVAVGLWAAKGGFVRPCCYMNAT